MPKINVLDTDVLILCGGRGTRFRTVQDNIPKALAPIQGKPFLDVLLDNLISQGFRRVILATGHLSAQIEAHVRERNDAEYVISKEPRPLGTGGAIKFAETHFRSDPVLVMNGDSTIECDLVAFLHFHLERQADLSVLLSSRTKGKDYGHVEVDNHQRMVAFHEKSVNKQTALISAGIYCLRISVLSELHTGKNYSLEKKLISIWLGAKQVYGWICDQPVHDIGTPERYHSLSKIIPTTS